MDLDGNRIQNSCKRGDIGLSVSMCMCVQHECTWRTKLTHVLNMPFSWFWYNETVQAHQLAVCGHHASAGARCGYCCHHV